jgi:hypothetical protein
MGKKSAPDAPQPVDPYQVARADADFNRIDQYTPYGSLTFGGPNRNQATLSFSPEMQQLMDSRFGMDQAMLDEAFSRMGSFDSAPIDLSQFGPIQSDAGLSEFSATGLPELPGDMDPFRQRIEDAVFQRGRRLLEPQFQRQEDTLRDTLANQGLPQTSEAFLDQYSQFNTDRGNTYQNLADSAVMMGGQEASRLLADTLAQRGTLFGEQLTGSNFNNAVRQAGLQNQNTGRVQGLNEALGIRGNQFNELASLLGLQQVQAPQMQNFFGPGQVDFMGAQALNAQQQQNAYQGQLQQQQAMLGGLSSLGAAGLMGAGAAGGFGNLFGGGGGSNSGGSFK